MLARFLSIASPCVLVACASQSTTPLPSDAPAPAIGPHARSAAEPSVAAGPGGGTWTPGPNPAPPRLDPELGYLQAWSESPALGFTARGLPEVVLRSMVAELVDPDGGARLATLHPWTYAGNRYEWHAAVDRSADLAWNLGGQQAVATTHTGLRVDPARPLDLGSIDLGAYLDAWVFDLTHPDPNAELQFNLKAADESGSWIGTGLPAEPGVFVVLAPPPVARLELRIGSTVGGTAEPRILELPPGRHTLDLSRP